MKPFKSLVFAGLFAGLSVNFAIADDIADVVMVSEDTVVINGTLTGCAERTITSATFCEDTLYTIQLTAEPQAVEDESCQAATNDFSLSFTLPENNQVTSILAQLFAFDENGEPLTENFELVLEETTEDLCAEECALDFAECTESCDTTCIDECAEDPDCIAACPEDLCLSDCQAMEEECLSTCPEPQTALICTPETLNLKSHGRWITCLVQSADIVDIEDVNLDSLMLNGTIAAERAVMQEDLLMLKFSRHELITSLLPGDEEELEFPMEIELTVTGNLMIDDSPFEATDSIRVIFPQPKGNKVKSQNKGQGSKSNQKGNK